MQNLVVMPKTKEVISLRQLLRPHHQQDETIHRFAHPLDQTGAHGRSADSFQGILNDFQTRMTLSIRRAYVKISPLPWWCHIPISILVQSYL